MLRSGRCSLAVASLALLTVLPGGARADWLDEMPSVAAVAEVIDREYNRGPESQSAVAVYTAAALILLRQVMVYRVNEDPNLTDAQGAQMQAIADEYLRAELAIGRDPGRRRGALNEAAVRQFYESRLYEKCATAECYRFWMGFQLEWWNAFKFRELILPQLFPCGSAAEVLAIAQRHALRSPSLAFTPAAARPSDLAAIATHLAAANRPAACTADGEDVDGDGLCADWEASLKKARLAKKAPGDPCAPFKLLRASTEDGESIRVKYS
ncbi:MAG: hypothetical protein ACRD3R_12325, partial [Terriglobales bacterium]